MRNRRLSALIVIAAVVPFAAACGSSNSPSTTEPVTTEPVSSEPATTEPAASDDSTQIANPASVFCVEQGGTVEIVDEADGQVGYCNLPDGTRIEEWEYYRSQNPSGQETESELPGDGVE